MAQKTLFGFTNLSAEIFLHVLGYTFCEECHILAHFHQMQLPLKALKIICANDVLHLRQIC
jgi:hypothetical protein